MFLNPQIVFRREFDGSGLLFHPDTGEVFALNPTAAAICELIAAGERDEAELLNSLARSTRLPPEAPADLRTFLVQLRRRGFLTEGPVSRFDTPEGGRRTKKQTPESLPESF